MTKNACAGKDLSAGTTGKTSLFSEAVGKSVKKGKHSHNKGSGILFANRLHELELYAEERRFSENK